MKDRYSYNHLKSAIFFAKNAHELEKKYEKSFESLKAEERENITEEYSAFTTSAIILSVAFIEAHINEFFDNVIEKKPNNSSSGTVIDKLYNNCPDNFKFIQSLFLLKEDIYDKLSFLKKYDFALVCFSKEPFEKGKKPYQNLKLIIDLRNSLVHYYPEYQTAQKGGMGNEQSKIEKKFQDKFDINPFFKNTGNPFYPHKCLSYSSAKWSIMSSYEFVEGFYSKFDLESGYKRIIKRLDEETPLEDIKKGN